MKMKTFARGIASVVSVVPRERKPVKYIRQMPLASRKRSDREAIWGDFCATGEDLSMVFDISEGKRPPPIPPANGHQN